MQRDFRSPHAALAFPISLAFVPSGGLNQDEHHACDTGRCARSRTKVGEFSRRWRITTLGTGDIPNVATARRYCTASSLDSGADRKMSCSYCEGKRIVLCPVCEGEGVIGRTILCRYCKGAKQLECPVCTAADFYQWTYSEPTEEASSEESDRE